MAKSKLRKGDTIRVTLKGTCSYDEQSDGYVQFESEQGVTHCLMEGETALAEVITPARPNNWPPQVGDVWTDRNDTDWFVRLSSYDYPVVVRDNYSSKSYQYEDALDIFLAEQGPVTLAYRKGVTNV